MDVNERVRNADSATTTSSSVRGSFDLKNNSSRTPSKRQYLRNFSTSNPDHLTVGGFTDPSTWIRSPPDLMPPPLQWDTALDSRTDSLSSFFPDDSLPTLPGFPTNSYELPDLIPWRSTRALSDSLGPAGSLVPSSTTSPRGPTEWGASVLASLLDDPQERGILSRLQNYLNTNSDSPYDSQSLRSLGWVDMKTQIDGDGPLHYNSAPVTKVSSRDNMSNDILSSDWRSSTMTKTPVLSSRFGSSNALHSLSAPLRKDSVNAKVVHHSASFEFSGEGCRTPNNVRQKRRKDRTVVKSAKTYYTKPGETTSISPSCCAILPSLPPEALAPLHIVLPINLCYGKIVIASNTTGHATREHPLHHYYFQKQFPSANNLFSRLHGLCNQSPSWLALDIGYVACREHQVAPVVDIFNNFFRQGFMNISKRRRNRSSRGRRDNCPHADNTQEFMDPVRLRCSGLRLREDHGSGWFLYETPVEACSEKDSTSFKEVIRLIESFNEHVRDSRLCQNATMKPFMNNQFAIVVLKQDSSGISARELARLNDFKCEGVEISEIRLVRHKLQDRFGNAMFEVQNVY